MSSDGVTQRIEEVRDATRRLLDGSRGLTDADVARPSLCAGWTVGHVLTHLARNADGLRRVALGAARGEVLSPYDSMDTRATGIEAGAGRPAAELRADVAASARRLAEAWQALDTMSADLWDRPFQHHRRGRTPVRDTPTMRFSEIEVHRVDLAGEYRPADWPTPFVRSVLEGIMDTAAGRLPPGVTLVVRLTDTATWRTCGPADRAPVIVSGPSWAVAAWLMGRVAPVRDALSVTGGELPVLAAWR